MRTLKIIAFVCALLTMSGGWLSASAQVSADGVNVPVAATDTVVPATDEPEYTTSALPPDTLVEAKPVRGIKYDPSQDAALGIAGQKPIPLLAGCSVMGDLAGAVMAVVAPFGQFEAAFRVNLRERYFPIFEMGWGISDHTDESTQIHYKTNAPYFRIGCDYNFANDLYSGNRIFGGLRYAFTSFGCDIDGPDIEDPVWGTLTPMNFDGLRSRMHWVELVFGLEAKIWSIFHVGWTARYKIKLRNNPTEIGNPWYVPGYGRNKYHVFSGTFNLIFDI
ncbi:MAG: DUF6048 family protein [Bacteroidales bacterium]|nr:DUF6048 family protein [Bacteroidales bacterium]